MSFLAYHVFVLCIFIVMVSSVEEDCDDAGRSNVRCWWTNEAHVWHEAKHYGPLLPGWSFDFAGVQHQRSRAA